MNYRSVAELNSDARRLAGELPRDIDVIVGIPRSGLLAANLLCLHVDLPMVDVDGLCEGRTLGTGHRYKEDTLDLSGVERVLVVDDSVNSGTQMRETQSRLDGEDLPFEIEYAAIYVTQTGYQYVDYWAEVVEKPRVFEWNLMHHPMLENFCVDIDGVLCRDPTRAENDDGDNYIEFISGVDADIVPSKKIGWLVTCRLEKYREETEAWLEKHGIEYENLVMMDHPSMEARQAAGDHAAYKADVYESTGAALFVESSLSQAAEIAERTGKPVYCHETAEMVRPDALSRAYAKSGDYLSRFLSNPLTFSSKACRYVVTKWRHEATRFVAKRRES